ncbi:MAG: hypothetical protein AAF800_01220 [Planctomycetota bacterium]
MNLNQSLRRVLMPVLKPVSKLHVTSPWTSVSPAYEPLEPRMLLSAVSAHASDGFVDSVGIDPRFTTIPLAGDTSVTRQRIDEKIGYLDELGVRHARISGTSAGTVQVMQDLAEDYGIQTILFADTPHGITVAPEYWTGTIFGNSRRDIVELIRDDLGPGVISYIENHNELDIFFDSAGKRWFVGDSQTLNDDPSCARGIAIGEVVLYSGPRDADPINPPPNVDPDITMAGSGYSFGTAQPEGNGLRLTGSVSPGDGNLTRAPQFSVKSGGLAPGTYTLSFDVQTDDKPDKLAVEFRGSNGSPSQFNVAVPLSQITTGQ